MKLRNAAWNYIGLGVTLFWLALGAGCGPTSIVPGTETEVDERVEQSWAGQAKALDFPQSSADHFTFLFVSDIHLTPGEGDWMDELDAYAQDANAAFILAGGDEVDSGELAEYQLYLDRTQGFFAAIYPAIGNHDIYHNGWEHYKRLLGPAAYSFEYGNSFFLFLDSAQATLGREQLDWVERKLSRASSRHKFVVSHFPIYDGTAQTPAIMGTPEERYKLIYLFDKYGVEYYLSGHKHTGEIYQIRDCWYIISGAGSTYKLIYGDTPHFWRFDVEGNKIDRRKIYFADLE